MPNSNFTGGVASVVIDGVGGDFTYHVTTNPDVVTIDKFTQEGNEWPKPAAVKDGVHPAQEGPTGEVVPFAFNALNMDPDDVDALKAPAFAMTPHDLQFTSADGKTVMVLFNVILDVNPAPINDFGKYGFVRFEGKATAAGATRAYSVTHTP